MPKPYSPRRMMLRRNLKCHLTLTCNQFSGARVILGLPSNKATPTSTQRRDVSTSSSDVESIDPDRGNRREPPQLSQENVTPFFPTSPAYPPPQVPVSPVLTLGAFWPVHAPQVQSVLDAGAIRFVTSGRCAIALALRQMAVGPGDMVLVPAYHCASMIEPVIDAGATPIFYRINPDTSIDLKDITSKITSTTKVLLAVNYFGFPQNLSMIRTFCNANRLQFLEDCAHCFLGEHDGKPVGSFGDYAIASSMKFYPIYEGGCLISAHHPLKQLKLESGGLGFEAKVAFNALEISFGYGRLQVLKALLWLPMLLKNAAWNMVKARNSATTTTSFAPSSSEGGFGFDPAWINKRSSVYSRVVMKLVSRRRIGALRRKNYLKLLAALGSLPHSRPLFPNLPEGVYPWVFPLWTANSKPVFDSLKNSGVPIVRFGEFLWPGIDSSICQTSVDLSRNVLSFSCHQEITDDELDWIIRSVQDALHAHGERQ